MNRHSQLTEITCPRITLTVCPNIFQQNQYILIVIHTGDGKSGDSTNFGIFKQNWYMLRNSASEFLSETASQVNDGAILK